MAQALHFSQRTRVREALDTHSPGFPLLHGCGAEGLYQSASCLSQPGSSRDGQDISKRLGHRAPGGQLVRRQLLFAPSHLPTPQGWARLGRGACVEPHTFGVFPLGGARRAALPQLLQPAWSFKAPRGREKKCLIAVQRFTKLVISTGRAGA